MDGLMWRAQQLPEIMDNEAIEDYVEQSQSLLETSPQMDEENTKVKLIQPLVELLGWDVYSTEVELEYPIQIGTQQSRVDYALLIGDTPIVFIEAKSAQSELTEDNTAQLRSYMRQELSVDWGVLTNGKSFEILGEGDENTDNGEVSIAEFSLDNMTDNPELLKILTKEGIKSGRAGERAKQIRQTNRAIRRLRQSKEPVAEQLADVLEGELGETPLDFEEQSLEFLDDLRETLRNQRQFIGKSKPEREGEDEPPDDDDDEEEEVQLEPAEDNVVGTIRRENIEGPEDAEVAVFPTRKSGLPFLKENNAWGFVRVGRDFDYVAMYLTRNAREVRYFATVQSVVPPENANLRREPIEYVDRDSIDDDKMVVQFEPDSLHLIEDPIQYETKYPQSLQYTTLGELRTAETTDDIL